MPEYDFTVGDIRHIMMQQRKNFSSMAAFAKFLGLSNSALSRFFSGESGPGKAILDYLGMYRVYGYNYKAPTNKEEI